jgi:hypothetical protein
MCFATLNYLGGWAYVRSRVLLHLESCSQRELETAAEFLELSSEIADRIVRSNPTSREDRIRS